MMKFMNERHYDCVSAFFAVKEIMILAIITVVITEAVQ